MDVSPRQDTRPAHTQTTDSASPTLSSTVPPNSNAHLAALLSDAYRDADSLRRELATTKKRAEKAERISHVLTAADVSGTPPPSTGGSGAGGGANGDPPNPQQQQHAHQLTKIVEEYEDRLARAEAARDEAEARRREALDGWKELESYLASLEIHARDARASFRTYISHESNGSSSLSFPSPGLYTPVLVAHHHHQAMAPPSGVPTRRHSSRHHHGGSSGSSAARGSGGGGSGQPVAFALPPHPNPNPNPTPTHAGARRPRTPSIDGLYSAAQPPSKRSRASGDDQRGREPRPSYSESYVTSIQHLPHPDYIRQHPQPQHLVPRPGGTEAQARIIDRKYRSSSALGHSGLPLPRPSSPSHSRSGSHSSASSMDVDEMIIKASTGDEAAGGNGAGQNGRPYLDSPLHHPHQHHLGSMTQAQLSGGGRRGSGREAEDSPRPAANSLTITTSANPYPPQQPSASSYPASQSAPSLRSIGAAATQSQGQIQGQTGPGQAGQGQPGHVYTTHVFAPVVTGAPTKKTKFPNSAIGAPVGGGVPGSGPSLDAPSAPSQPVAAAVPFAPTNAQGQRICRQCGIVGRYKDGKCVEKWGPGPMGPGTVCDRCRKKMKRVERRGTLENQQQQQLATLQAQQQQQHQPRTTSHAQLPLSQGSDRSIHRSDTILTQQPSFAARDREPSSNLRSSNASTMSTNSPGKAQRQQPTPPSIVALREQHDDDDEHENDDGQERDVEQLPTSNIGRGGSVNKSRSNSRNGRVRSGARPTPPKNDLLSSLNGQGHAKRSPLARGSISPHEGEVDEMDADADADADAEAELLGAVDAAGEADDVDGDGDGEGELEADADAEAELLDAVDAAEANSSSSHGGGRSWLKPEPS